MAIDLDDEVKVAGGAAIDAGIALARQPDPLPIARTGLMRTSTVSVRRHRSLAVASRAFVLQLAGAATPRAGDLEFHASTHLGHLAGALTFRTGTAAGAGFSFTCGTGFLPHYLDTRHAAADRCPKIYRDLILQISSWLRPWLLLSLGKHAGENIPEAAPA